MLYIAFVDHAIYHVFSFFSVHRQRQACSLSSDKCDIHRLRFHWRLSRCVPNFSRGALRQPQHPPGFTLAFRVDRAIGGWLNETQRQRRRWSLFFSPVARDINPPHHFVSNRRELIGCCNVSRKLDGNVGIANHPVSHLYCIRNAALGTLCICRCGPAVVCNCKSELVDDHSARASI